MRAVLGWVLSASDVPWLSGSDGVLGVSICPQETNSSLSQDLGTCSHEKMNFPRPDSVGKVTRVALGSLEEGGGSVSRDLCFFSIGLEIDFEGRIYT